MNFFKKSYTIRRYTGEPQEIDGYLVSGYEDITMRMDVQTTDETTVTAEDGDEAVQTLKAFCDSEIYTNDAKRGSEADRLWFQGKWFECRSSRLSENTPLRHWTTTFVECLVQDDPPGGTT